ncbi:DNA-binding transcriptional regulator, MerR family [Amycolatopsis tolypomycina]|uniref:DNA-binding transcriptional regulator, MerR family n=1 Tax=Amycolatopsis tolypomycina TaxID=208445 RepID=A0A1H5DQ44_9PSEU|nr:MerR family transcriptional regulator [Amycolatopsis tolypomycina]SED80992.1 DNA-binding transcriptional regulator, MerR family [Amycolatopsis tolypomycina]
MQYSIGELAHRTGLTVKAVRFYSDRGLVPPSGRNTAGQRRYDDAALARLDVIRVLRDLGIDLATIRRVIDGETTVAEVAAEHCAAVAAQIGVLQRRSAVLNAVANRGSRPEEAGLAHQRALLSEVERQCLIGDFLADALGDRPELAGIARTLTPDLPADPSPEQAEAWIELAALMRDPEFRANLRRLADGLEAGLRRDLTAEVRDAVTPAVAAGIVPKSPAAKAIVDGLGRDPGELREWLRAVNDPRRERYLELLGVINGWAAPESLAPTFDWLAEAMAA